MSDPIARNLQRLNQAKYNYDTNLLRSSGLQNPSFNEGFDLNKGKLRINTIGEGIGFAAPISTGGIAIGDLVVRKGGFADSTTFVETTQQAVARKSVPSIQTIFTSDNKIWIGGDRPSPKVIFELQSGDSIASVMSHNRGRGKHVTGLKIVRGTDFLCFDINERGIIYQFSVSSGRGEFFDFIGNRYWTETWGKSAVGQPFPSQNVEDGSPVPALYAWNPLVVLNGSTFPTATAERFIDVDSSGATIPMYMLPSVVKQSGYLSSESSSIFDYYLPLIVGRNGESVVYVRLNPPTRRYFYLNLSAGFEVEITNGFELGFADPAALNVFGIGNLINDRFSWVLGTDEAYKNDRKIDVAIVDLRGDDGGQISPETKIRKVQYFPIRESRFPDAFFYWSSYHPG